MTQVPLLAFRVIETDRLNASELEAALNACTQEAFNVCGIVGTKVILSRLAGMATVGEAPRVAPVLMRPA